MHASPVVVLWPIFQRAARRAWLLFALTIVLVVSGPRSAQAVNVSFGTGSLIIPMDTDSNGQNNGMLTAYGLVYELLRDGVPVYWIINPAKGANGNDFSVVTTSSLQDVRTGATVAPRNYRGGPYLIAASDAAAALPIIEAWQVTVGDQTTVHRFVGVTALNLPVNRLLVSAPRIGVIKDGNETIAFNNLNAARIPDSAGSAWSSGSPDLLTEADLAGPTTTSHSDGVLFTSSGARRYCFIAAMHYNTTSTTAEVISEVRSWLLSNLSHAYAQCEAIRAFENASSGLFLTYAGLDDDGVATNNPIIRVPTNPLTQMDGTFQTDSGSVDSFRAKPSGGFVDYKPGATTLINDSTSNLLQRITLLDGRMDGQSQNGEVTYLAGHDYSLDLPITSNPQTNGVRLFLNSIFKSDCATQAAQNVTITKTAPAYIRTNEIPYTITISNSALVTASTENVVVTDALPAGTTYITGSGSPAPTSIGGGVLTWNLPPLAPGDSTVITFRVSATSDGTYSNTASVDFANVIAQSISSSPAITVRDTVPPVVTIPVPPNLTSFGTSTPSFTFSVTGNPVSTQCAIDNTSFVPCTSSYSASVLNDGLHTFSVRATDAAGNTGSANLGFSIASLTVGVTACTDNDCPPTFTIQATQRVSRDLIVHYRMTGPGVFGVDYTVAGTFGQIVIPAGQTSATVNLIKLAGDRFVKGKTATMWLVASPDYNVNPKQIIATVFIFRNR